MTADPTVYLVPPGGSHVLGTDGAGMDIFSRVMFAPRVDLAIAIVGTLLSAMIGGAHRRVRRLLRGPAGMAPCLEHAGDARRPTCCRRFRCSYSRSRSWPCSAKACKSIILAIAFVNAPIYLRLMRAQVLSISKLRYVEAAYVAGARTLRSCGAT